MRADSSCLLQVVFALNRQWLLNEKGALRPAESFAIKPDGLKRRLEAALEISASPGHLNAALAALGLLIEETSALA